MSGQFDWRKDSQLTKFGRRSWIFVKLSFRELFDLKLSGLQPFDNMAIIHWENRFIVSFRVSALLKYWPQFICSILTLFTQPPQKKILNLITWLSPLKCTLVQKSADSFFKGTKDLISNNEIRTHLNVQIWIYSYKI